MKEELIGLKNIKEHQLKCGDCQTPLVEIILIETKESMAKRDAECFPVKYKAILCYKCGGDSFESPIFDGSTITGPPSSSKDKLSIDFIDIEENKKDGYRLVTLKARKED